MLVCPFCGKLYPNWGHLLRHVQKHVEERWPYCPVCRSYMRSCEVRGDDLQLIMHCLREGDIEHLLVYCALCNSRNKKFKEIRAKVLRALRVT